MEGLDSAQAGRRIAGFLDDLSNWYVRRSRRRFWAGTGSLDGAAAFATLRSVLDVLTRLMAPITPFVTDYVWDVLRSPGAPDSVHLASWPAVDAALIDAGLAGQMALTRRLVELGRSARASAAVKVRQPLGQAAIAAPGFDGLPAELISQIADELNVRELTPLDAADERPRQLHRAAELPRPRQEIRERHAARRRGDRRGGSRPARDPAPRPRRC